ncbi:MAG: PLP-dependent aminotransferase family protein [Asticcacaulis sp.]|nr:PLP-dependent aminotransferase family protein [Asticcacaulis sp.]
MTLQDQLRKQLTLAAIAGAFTPGKRLPSSRALASQLGLSRNTVLLAYQKLIDEGLFISRERSGLYVNPVLLKGRVAIDQVAGLTRPGSSHPDEKRVRRSIWSSRFKNRITAGKQWARRLPHWRQYPYPFIDGLFDESLFPVHEWRDAMRSALAVAEINAWSVDAGDADDAMLIEEIRTKVLSRRGISARADEILITLGSQQSLSLLMQMLVDKSVTVAVEEPGYPDLRRLITQNRGRIRHQKVDDQGLIVDETLSSSQIICVTPSHQYPTGATLSLERRHALLQSAEANDQIVIEDDYASETDYLETTLPSLYSLAQGQRVIYVAGLSKVLSPGLRLGFMVAAPEVIAEARALRRLLIRHPPMNIQRAAAHFLAMGHYDATMMRVGKLFRERRTALRDALNHYMRNLATIMPLHGGTTYWVQGPPELDVHKLIDLAEQKGVLIESAAPYYASDAPQNEFLVGVTSLSLERIRQGMAILRDCIRQLLGYPALPLETGQVLATDAAIRLALSGSSFLYRTVYSDPCTIDLLPDGRMTGRAGYANEDCDTGRWWIEDGRWCRQWKSWAYGEVSRYHILIDDKRIYWLDEMHLIVDSAIYIRPDEADLSA